MQHTPIPVFLNIRGINYQEILLRIILIHQQIVYDTPFFIREASILHFTGSKCSYIIRSHFLKKSQCIRTFHPEFTHMRYIKYTNSIAHRKVFVDDTCILNRHIISSKLMHLSTQCNMLVGKWSGFHDLRFMNYDLYGLLPDRIRLLWLQVLLSL